MSVLIFYKSGGPLRLKKTILFIPREEEYLQEEKYLYTSRFCTRRLCKGFSALKDYIRPGNC